MVNAEELLKLILKASNFNSLLNYYGRYFICFDELGREIEISKEEFDYLSKLVDKNLVTEA